MRHLLRDVRQAWRNLGRRPGFAVTAILILGVGIGATTTIFSVVDTVLLRRLPYPAAGRLVAFTHGVYTGPDFVDWRRRLDAFDALAAAWSSPTDLAGGGLAEQVPGARVSERFFQLFDGHAVLGRLFGPDDFRPGSAVAVIGAGLWHRRWGGDPGIVGRRVRLDGNPVTIVGVLGAAFEPPSVAAPRRTEIWTPLDWSHSELQDRGAHVLTVIGRLRPGVSLEIAQEQLDALRRQQVKAFPSAFEGRSSRLVQVPLEPLRDAMVSEVRDRLELLLAAVGLLLLLACGDVAILLLARGMARLHEMALRAALGARRGRLAGQLLTESACLGLAGGALGVLLAFAGTWAFKRFQPGGLPRIEHLAVDLRVLAFAVGISVATALLFGLLPALQAARVHTAEMLKDGGSGGGAGPRRERARSALVVAEVAVALTLLVGSGLLFRSLLARLQVDPGFETGGLLTFSVTPGTLGGSSPYEPADRVRLAAGLRREIGALPGVRAVGGGWVLPFFRTGPGRCCWHTELRVPGSPQTAEPLSTTAHPVTPGYFAALEAPLALGRGIEEGDGTREPAPAVLAGVTARRLFGKANPIGKTLELVHRDKTDEIQVVGVVDGLHQFGLDQAVDDAVYVPYARFGGHLPFLDVAVRTAADPASLAPAVRRVVARLDPDLPVEQMATMPERVSRSLAEPRFLSLLFATFAAVALLLSVGGIYGSMAYWVSQRHRDLGIRMAVGAGRLDVVALVLRRGLALTGFGLVLGIGGSLALARGLEGLVWGVTTHDPVSLAAAVAVLATSAAAACLFPARRATRVDPVDALRAG